MLQCRTGLQGIFLWQFATFGVATRCNANFSNSILDFYGMSHEEGKWFSSRFLTVGYYVLVDFLQAVSQPDGKNDVVEWIDHKSVSELILDHRVNLSTALQTLRMELNLMPVGYNLLQEKFTISDLQKLYETILDRKLDRRNFYAGLLLLEFW